MCRPDSNVAFWCFIVDRLTNYLSLLHVSAMAGCCRSFPDSSGIGKEIISHIHITGEILCFWPVTTCVSRSSKDITRPMYRISHRIGYFLLLYGFCLFLVI